MHAWLYLNFNLPKAPITLYLFAFEKLVEASMAHNTQSSTIHNVHHVWERRCAAMEIESQAQWCLFSTPRRAGAVSLSACCCRAARARDAVSYKSRSTIFMHNIPPCKQLLDGLEGEKRLLGKMTHVLPMDD